MTFFKYCNDKFVLFIIQLWDSFSQLISLYSGVLPRSQGVTGSSEPTELLVQHKDLGYGGVTWENLPW